jgi:hypothetical protein
MARFGFARRDRLFMLDNSVFIWSANKWGDTDKLVSGMNGSSTSDMVMRLGLPFRVNSNFTKWMHSSNRMNTVSVSKGRSVMWSFNVANIASRKPELVDRYDTSITNTITGAEVEYTISLGGRKSTEP